MDGEPKENESTDPQLRAECTLPAPDSGAPDLQIETLTTTEVSPTAESARERETVIPGASASADRFASVHEDRSKVAPRSAIPQCSPPPTSSGPHDDHDVLARLSAVGSSSTANRSVSLNNRHLETPDDASRKSDIVEDRFDDKSENRGIVESPELGSRDEADSDASDDPQVLRRRVALSDLWPGFSRLYHDGQPVGLLCAVSFAVLLNATLVTWLLWPSMLTATQKLVLAAITAGGWCLGVCDARRAGAFRNQRSGTDSQVDLFLAARGEYLRGEWKSAEKRLSRMIAVCPQDVSARLLLATLLRHQGRFIETKDQLRRLQRWRAAADWTMEVRREWELVARAEMASAASPGIGESDPARLRQQKRSTRAIRNVSAFGRAA